MTRKTVFAVVSVVVALAITTILWVNRPGPDAPVSSPSPVASSTPTPTPSPDPREVAIAEAEAVYLEYSDASWAMTKAKGSKKQLVEKLRPYVTGMEWKTVQADAKFLREQQARVSGDRKIHFLSPGDVKLTGETPTLSLNVCLDLSEVEAISPKGKKINGSWTKSQVFMVKDGKTWKVEDRDDEIRSDSCIE